MDGANAYYHLGWAHGELSVRAVGGMIAPLIFDLGAGCRLSPLHVAPWAGGTTAGLSPLLAGLRGEWPCLPFGPAHIPANLPTEWQPLDVGDRWDHGYCANHAWRRIRSPDDRPDTLLSLAIDLPTDDPVERLERHIRPDPEAPAVAVELVIHPRRDAVIPFALHPTFVVPADGVDLVGGSYASVCTYPMPAEAGVSCLQPDCCVASLRELPMADGGVLDVTSLPLSFRTEELLQAVSCKPPFVLRYTGQHAEVELDWETEHLPDALLWISNGGRAYHPWCSTHYALGIEPNNSCFDLGRVAVPPAGHPLAGRRGLHLAAGVPLRLTYRLRARRLVGSGRG